MKARSRLRRGGLVAAAAGTATALFVALGGGFAYADTLFADNFEGGNSNNWSKSGGSWSVTGDGSQVLRQSSTSSDARATAGTATWTDYTVQARVKPTAFNGTDRSIGLAARVQTSSSYYALVLTNAGRLELRERSGGTQTVLASAPATVTVGGWHTLALEVTGTGLRGLLNGAALVNATDSTLTSGRVGLLAAYANGSFDDVTVTGAGTAPPTTTPTVVPTGTTAPPTTGPPTNPPPQTPAGLVGYGAVSGRGLATTTGGAGGAVVTVTDAAGFETQAGSRDTLVIQVSGIITLNDAVYVRSNKTIVGVGANSGFTGGGLKMSGQQNIIIRNLKISFPVGVDAITVQNSHHVWIDHNELSSDRAHDIDYYDGLIDITHASDFITVSWNILRDHWKTSLIGHDDDNVAEDTGHLTVTYHHNHWSNLDARGPSVRFGTAHVYNNYYSNVVNGVHSRMSAQVLVENNVFRNTGTPIKTTTLSVQDGYAVERGNDFGGGVNNITQVGSFTTPPYAYPLDPTTSVIATVTAGAGTGRI
ncbi:pectate lyase [Micromonospora sp. NBC_01699]|uniref:pectate lyase family protein n=1 Tax=Micromonospora sp. NBC_01699 TaxID=2975984 RepID=UPI002E29BAF5|nr:family 16 glycoside hydrolase [Micromonospora sp. NBC_01699]